MTQTIPVQEANNPSQSCCPIKFVQSMEKKGKGLDEILYLVIDSNTKRNARKEEGDKSIEKVLKKVLPEEFHNIDKALLFASQWTFKVLDKGCEFFQIGCSLGDSAP